MPKYLNPLRKESGRLAAWYLFVQLGRPWENDYERFENILFRAVIRHSSLYKKVAIPKRGKGKRMLLIPCADLMFLQRLINKSILMGESEHPNSYGFSGGNVRQALQRVVEAKQPIFTADVYGAFPHTFGETVFNIFHDLGYGFYSSYYLTCLTTWPKINVGELPQGAPTSPRLFDMAFEPLDNKLSKLAKRVGGVYVRYADNLFFTAPTFWPPQVIKEYVEGETPFIDGWGNHGVKNHQVSFKTIPEGIESYHFERGACYWHSPLISAIFHIVANGYVRKPKIKWTSKYWKFCAEQNYYLHKAFLADPDKVFHALGLNIIDGQLHNQRRFKKRLRMTIYNLQKALANKDPFEAIVWPLYLQAQGMMNWAIEETLPQALLEQWAYLDYHVYEIRYANPSGTWKGEITDY
ncbi:reverse transcriptase domain-containing protein [Patescibacteria group bacterium]